MKETEKTLSLRDVIALYVHWGRILVAQTHYGEEIIYSLRHVLLAKRDFVVIFRNFEYLPIKYYQH